MGDLHSPGGARAPPLVPPVPGAQWNGSEGRGPSPLQGQGVISPRVQSMSPSISAPIQRVLHDNTPNP